MRTLVPVIIAAALFVVSFVVNRPRLRPVMTFVCAVLAVFFIVTAILERDHRFVSLLFAVLSIYMFLKHLKKPRALERLER